MRHSLRRAAAGALCALLLAAAIVRGGGSAGRAAEEILIGQTEPAGEAPRYLLVRPFDDSAWSDSWNDLHYVYPQGRPGERYAAYCLESHRTSPAGQIYREIERPDYSASAERGLKAIFRLGYPYRSAFGDRGEIVLSATDARAATQIAIRFFMSYRQTLDTDRDYHVIRALNPYNGNVRAANSDAARRVFEAAMWLFHKAEAGYAPTFGMQITELSTRQPEVQGEDCPYEMTFRVYLSEKASDIVCDYAQITSVTARDSDGNARALGGGIVTRQTDGIRETVSDGIVHDGDLLILSWPSSDGPGGCEVSVTLTGISDAADLSLRYMGAADGSLQKLFVTRLEEGAACRATASVTYRAPAIPSPTPTNTPVPTNTPTPTEKPEPTATNTPTPTEIPVPTATNTPTPTEIPEPTATNTPTPTEIPEPTATDTPTPTNTPTPFVEVVTVPPIFIPNTPTPTAAEVKSAVAPDEPQSPKTGDTWDAGWTLRWILLCIAGLFVTVFRRERRRIGDVDP